MSEWQGFVNNELIAGGLNASAIINQDGTLLAQSSNFSQFNEEDIKAIMNGFNEPGPLYESRVLGDTKYFVTGVNPPSIYGKKEADEIIIRKTITTLIIGVYDAKITATQADQVVQKLGDFLEENNN